MMQTNAYQAPRDEPRKPPPPLRPIEGVILAIDPPRIFDKEYEVTMRMDDGEKILTFIRNAPEFKVGERISAAAGVGMPADAPRLAAVPERAPVKRIDGEYVMRPLGEYRTRGVMEIAVDGDSYLVKPGTHVVMGAISKDGRLHRGGIVFEGVSKNNGELQTITTLQTPDELLSLVKAREVKLDEKLDLGMFHKDSRSIVDVFADAAKKADALIFEPVPRMQLDSLNAKPDLQRLPGQSKAEHKVAQAAAMADWQRGQDVRDTLQEKAFAPAMPPLARENGAGKSRSRAR